MSTKAYRIKLTLLVILLSVMVAGCSSEPTLTSSEMPQDAQPDPTQADIATLEPSPTPVPLAAQVNGTGITEAEYRAELARYQAEAGTELATEDEAFVLQDMINQLLLAQAAEEAGYVVDEAQVQERINQLGVSDQALQDWLTDNSYDDDSFRNALARSIAAAWMRDQIIADVPEIAEQVHARQILLYNSEEADAIFAQISTAADFETLAEQYDPLAKGDLGWFPKGYLTVSELDEIIFSLAPGEYSPIVETELGFHIIQVIERDSAYPLNFSTYQVVQKTALENWLHDRQSQSEIIYSLP